MHAKICAWTPDRYTHVCLTHIHTHLHAIHGHVRNWLVINLSKCKVMAWESWLHQRPWYFSLRTISSLSEEQHSQWINCKVNGMKQGTHKDTFAKRTHNTQKNIKDQSKSRWNGSVSKDAWSKPANPSLAHRTYMWKRRTSPCKWFSDLRCCGMCAPTNKKINEKLVLCVLI